MQRQDHADHRGGHPGDEGHDEQPRDAGQAQHRSVGRGGHVHDCAGAAASLRPDFGTTRTSEPLGVAKTTGAASYPGSGVARRARARRVVPAHPTARGAEGCPAPSRGRPAGRRGSVGRRWWRPSWSARARARRLRGCCSRGCSRRPAPGRTPAPAGSGWRAGADRLATTQCDLATARRISHGDRAARPRRRASPTWRTRRPSWATRTRPQEHSPTTSRGSRRRRARWRPRSTGASPASRS